MAKQIQKILTGLLLVIIATLTASEAVTAELADERILCSYKNKDKN